MKLSRIVTAESTITIQYEPLVSDGEAKHVLQARGAEVHSRLDEKTKQPIVSAKFYVEPEGLEINSEIEFVNRIGTYVTGSGKGVVVGLAHATSHIIYTIAVTEWNRSETEGGEEGLEKLVTNITQRVQDWSRPLAMLHPPFSEFVRKLQLMLIEWHTQLKHARFLLEMDGIATEEANRMVAEKVYDGTPDRPGFKQFFGAQFAEFERLARAVPYDRTAERFGVQVEDVMNLHIYLVRRSFHSLMMRAPFIKRVYGQPLGFAGDFMMMEQILSDERFLGPDPLSMCLNRLFLESPIAVGVRERVGMFFDLLKADALKVLETQDVYHITDFACGSGPYVRRLFQDPEVGSRIHYTGIDISRHALAYFKARLDELRPAHSFIEPTLIRDNVVVFAKRYAQGKRKVVPNSDATTCPGMIDYCDDEQAHGVLDLKRAHTRPGGLSIWSQVLQHSIQYIMLYIGDWDLILRTLTQMERVGAPFGSLQHLVDPSETNALQCIRFPSVRSL